MRFFLIFDLAPLVGRSNPSLPTFLVQILRVARVTGSQIITQGPITLFYFGIFFLVPEQKRVIVPCVMI